MEVAMKLLEKDIHEKQDTIISLRRQLDEIKLINLEMYKKLQVTTWILFHSLIAMQDVSQLVNMYLFSRNYQFY